MNRLILFMFLALVCVRVGYGQPSLDSLKHLIQTAPNSEAKLNLYIKVITYLTDSQPELELATLYTDSLYKLADELNNKKARYEAIFYYGAIASYEGNYDRAQEHMQEYITYKKSTGDSLSVAGGLFYLGVIHNYLGNYERSLAIYYRVAAITEKLGDQINLANTYNTIGSIYKKANKLKEAIAIFNQASAIFKQLDEQVEHAMCLQNLGNSYLKSKQYEEAQKYLNESLETLNEIKSKDFLAEVYFNISELYVAQHDYEKAFSFYKMSTLTKDSLFNAENVKQLDELQTKYETEKKNKQIMLLAKEKEVQAKETQRQAMLVKATTGGLVLLGLLIILLLYIFYQRLKNQRLLAIKNDEIKEVNFKHKMSELEMKALRAQINPHFLFNCMSSINRMILSNETENASLYLGKFSKLVRMILENTEAPAIPLENEIAMLKAYIQLEELRFKEKISFTIEVDQAINQEQTYLPSMIVQPFVENAIWHGLMHKPEGSEKGSILIKVSERKDNLVFSIEDNGVGREKAKAFRNASSFKNKSMGIKITEERLRLLNRAQLQEVIQITDLKDSSNIACGTRVEVSIPIA